MKIIHSILYPFLLIGIVTARGEPKPFVTYPAPVNSCLKRVQEGRQAHTFDGSVNFKKWQKQARQALIELTGLRQMEKALSGFKSKVIIGKADNSPEGFSRSLCSIETEPGANRSDGMESCWTASPALRIGWVKVKPGAGSPTHAS